jgi:predicted nucleic acid-binding protein
MAEALIFDTTFLIDFQRERLRGEADGRAHRFLAVHADAAMALPVVALGEFAEGFADPNDPVLRQTARHFDLLPVDDATAYCCADITRRLRRNGRLIGSNDLWIAACALRHGRPLVTRNAAEFGRVPGLEVSVY